jgi:hypothetical protein
MSMQALQPLLLCEVSTAINSKYSCTPDGPLENSLITKVWEKEK